MTTTSYPLLQCRAAIRGACCRRRCLWNVRGTRPGPAQPSWSCCSSALARCMVTGEILSLELMLPPEGNACLLIELIVILSFWIRKRKGRQQLFKVTLACWRESWHFTEWALVWRDNKALAA